MCMHEMKLSQYRLLLHCYIPNYLSSANLYVVNIFGEGGKDGHPKIKILWSVSVRNDRWLAERLTLLGALIYSVSSKVFVEHLVVVGSYLI